MFITELTVKNFKLFQGEHSFKFKGGLVFLVGENNTGKTSILEALDFLKSGLDKRSLEVIKNKGSTDEVLVKAKLQGQINQIISDFGEARLSPYVFTEDGKETILLQRSSEVKEITQNSKTVKLDIKKITLWNPSVGQFENPTGIDTVIGSLLETQFIWSDTHPDEVTDFGTTKICGKLLNSIMGDFQTSQVWTDFITAHKNTFHGTDSLSTRAKLIEDEIQNVFKSQYGDVNIKFDFTLPEAKTFFTSTSIKVDDGVETDLKEKGSGMQRSMALAILQVYAKMLTRHESDSSKFKPLFFFIDEPEISLHPKAQKTLLESLIKISATQQIFLTTHSPYLLKQFDSTQHDLIVFRKEAGNLEIIPDREFKLFKWSPSWGEINYLAYDLCTEDFHNELYGALQEQEAAYKEADIENFFTTKTIPLNKSWVRVKAGTPQPAYNTTLMTFIRNTIHHPENRQNLNYSEQELKTSIDTMRGLVI